MPKVDSTVCPNCKCPVERQGRDYYCENCNLLFRPEKKGRPSTKELLEDPLFQIQKLKKKMRLLGVLFVLSGITFLLYSSLSSLFLAEGLLELLIGIYLIV